MSKSEKNYPERIFISYAHQDTNIAVRLYEELRSKTNLRPWLDERDLLPGQDYDFEIRKAIKNSRYFFALFSSTSVSKRGYIQKEFKRALDVLDEIPEGEIFAIPVRLDNCEIPKKFSGLERVDMFPDWDKGIQKIIQVTGRKPRWKKLNVLIPIAVGSVIISIFIIFLINPPAPPELNDYQFVSGWGSNGSANGEFNALKGIAADPSGNIYVADTGNSRIQKFNSNGKFITQWRYEDVGANQPRNLQDLAVDPFGNVYVVDSYNNRVEKFTGNGTFMGGWATYSPMSIAIEITERVYVANSGDQIQRKAIDDPFFTPWGNYNDFKFTNGVGIAVDSSGNVYVADAGNNQVHKISSNGTLITTWGSPGKKVGQFINPLAIAVDQSDNVYVADSGNNRIQKFSTNGEFITKIGSGGSADGQLIFPAGVAVDLSGTVYVADQGNNRIQVFAAASNSSS